MDLQEISEVLLKLVLAVILGGSVGWEREILDRPAGLRTHVLVCVGAASYMLVGTMMADGHGRNIDPSRIGSQVATGMGFLGAGTIIRHGSVVRGLTTAASLWTVAAIGLCLGAGGRAYAVAIAATAVVLITLTALSRVERVMVAKRQYRNLILHLLHPRERVRQIQECLHGVGVRVQGMDFSIETEEGLGEARLIVRIPPGLPLEQVTTCLAELEGVQGIQWE